MYKILIADDEIIECRSLEMMIRNSFPNAEILPSVYCGTDLIASAEKNHPDIAVVDINMPGMNGLDALEVIRSRNRKLKIIISSAYSEFSYAKRALTLGVTDYILKPLEKEVFLETLHKVFGMLQEERSQDSKKEEDEIRRREWNAVAGKEFLSSLLLGEAEEGTFQMYLQSIRQEYHGGFLMAVRPWEDENLPDQKQWKALLKKIEAEMGKYSSCVGKLQKEELYFLVLPSPYVKEENMEAWAMDTAEILCAMHKEPEELKLKFGISTWKYDCEEMVAGLKECRIALRSAKDRKIVFYEKKRNRNEAHLPETLLEECLDLVKNAEGEACIRTMEQFLETAEIPETAIEAWQAAILEFMIPVCEEAKAERGDLLFYSREGRVDFAALCSCGEKRELEQWVRENLGKLFLRKSHSERKSLMYVERTLLYMEKNFQQDISLENAAEDCEISSFYLSRLLKQELNRTFVEILTDIRMREALRLLREGRYTIREIAVRSGYGNIPYFYRVFKRYTGRNAGEIREVLERRKDKIREDVKIREEI